jgi:hypothetical protein
MEGRADRLTVNPEYVLGQFARALASSEGHPDAAVRARADEKVRKWRQVFEGMLGGTLQVGSRTPVAETPAWATLEVAHGGFATGSLLAGGELQAHERELRERLDARGVASGRAALNLFYLSDVGREELLRCLRSGCYRVTVPEEGALLTVVWLVAHGATDEAQRLVEAIAPFFDRLRFFPTPHARPLVGGTMVRLQPIATTMVGLRATHEQSRVLAMNEALAVWTPLYDRAVALFLETIDGPVPTLRIDEAGELVRRPDGQPHVDGGWPCRSYPPDWASRAKALLADYERARASHRRCGKHERKKENFTRLRGYLDRATTAPSTLTGRDVGMVRKILASFVTRHGAPGSDALAKLRAAQTEVASRPTHGALRSVVLDRLAALPSEDGLPSVDVVAGPVTPAESALLHVPAGARMPRSVVRKLQRSLEGTVEDLVRQNVIPSAEVLGIVLPQMTSQIRAAGISDPELRRLYAAVYAAFPCRPRRRRELVRGGEREGHRARADPDDPQPGVTRRRPRSRGRASPGASRAGSPFVHLGVPAAPAEEDRLEVTASDGEEHGVRVATDALLPLGQRRACRGIHAMGRGTLRVPVRCVSSTLRPCDARPPFRRRGRPLRRGGGGPRWGKALPRVDDGAALGAGPS